MHSRRNGPIVGSNGKTALLVEGGALRGSYAVGVLRTLHELGGPNQFDAIVAVSSGVFAATYFAAGQVEEMESTWRNLVHGSQLISFRRRLKGQPILGLDYLIDLFKGTIRLDLEKVYSSNPSLAYVLTERKTGFPYYADAKNGNIFDLMRASAGLPWLYHRPIRIQGIRYHDGGYSDPIPVRWLIEQGFKEIVAVLTSPIGYKQAPAPWVQSVMLFPGSRGARRGVRQLHKTYNDAVDLVTTPPSDVKVILVRPSSESTPRLARHKQRIIDGIELGKRDASRIFGSIRQTKERNAPESDDAPLGKRSCI